MLKRSLLQLEKQLLPVKKQKHFPWERGGGENTGV
jgi:hypothetical protein